MSVLRMTQKAVGTTLSITLPQEMADKEVEIIVSPMEKPSQPEADPRFAGYIKSTPDLTEEDKALFAQNRYPLRGMGSDYIDPFEPAVPPEDWDVYRAEAEVKRNGPT